MTLRTPLGPKVELDSESYDIGGDFDVGNYRYTAPVTGYYFVSAQIRFEDVIADKAYDLAIYVNGAALPTFKDLFSYRWAWGNCSPEHWDSRASYGRAVYRTVWESHQYWVKCD